MGKLTLLISISLALFACNNSNNSNQKRSADNEKTSVVQASSSDVSVESSMQKDEPITKTGKEMQYKSNNCFVKGISNFMLYKPSDDKNNNGVTFAYKGRNLKVNVFDYQFGLFAQLIDEYDEKIDLGKIEMLNLNDREKVIKRMLAPIQNEYDYILIDCSPSLGLITVNALTAADSVIIPVQCEYFALEGISKLLNTIKIIKTKLNPKLEIEGFLLTMYDSRLRLANQIYDEVKRHFQELVFKTVIQRNVKLSECPSHGLPVILYDAESTGSKNHLALAKEIINKNS